MSQIPPEKTPDILTKLREISFSKRIPVISDYLRDQISKILRVSNSGISGSDNLMQLGMDSLLFIELAKIMETDLKTRIPPRYFIQSPYIDALGKFLIEKMGDLDTDYSKSKEYFSIVPDPDNRYVPFGLTDIQQAYWIGRVNTLELGNIACHVYMEIDATNLDYARYNQVWQILIHRHEMLRAIILPDGSQKILETVPAYQIETKDLTQKSPEEAEAALASTRDFMSHQVLDPEVWPIFDIRISRIDNETSRIHLSLDMLVVDALSVSQLMKELSLLYRDESVSLPPLDLSFRDYVLAEKQFEASDLFQQSKAYWMDRLTDIPPGPELPLIKNPGDVVSPHFRRRTLKLAPDTWKQLKTKAANAGLTPSGLLLSCYAEVLSTWSRSPRFTINMTLFNRLPVHPQVNDIIGDFTSLIMLVVDVGSQSTFIERAQKIQDQFWRDVEHRHFSGVAVLRELSRMQSENISMPVVFTSNIVYGDLDEISPDSSAIGDVVYTVTQTPQVWLDHQITEQGNTLVLDWDAVEELFPEGLLDDMFNAYHSLLNRLAVSDDWHVNWDLMPADQIQQRKDINATSQPISSETLNSLFIKQAEQQPDHTAVVTSSGRISYRELHCRSIHIASLLGNHGKIANTLVAVVMEKGWEQVVAVLGILNAGAAYLPIDPSVPKERLWLLLKDGGVGLVLTQSWLEEKLEWPENTERFSVDEQGRADKRDIPIEGLQTPDDLAYVIYTSGSTGFPKGVMVDHRGAVNTILDVNKRFSIEPRDRVLAMSNLNFDLSVFDIFGTLAAGGTIVMPDSLEVKDPGHWLELMKREKVTVWNSVPQFMKMLVEYVSGSVDSVPESLRLALLSGDWIPLDLPDKIRAVSKNVQLMSLGGATEASIWSILYPINNIDPRWKSIPYGRPMTNQKIYVLREKMKACPNWVTGQLYIGGTGLAKGYWKDNRKTNASFIMHPETKERLYKTGDLGKYLPDGNIEFIGRDDFQVKINGYRIELGEIESAVKQFNGIDEVIVKISEENRVNKQLTAYVRLHEGLFLDTDALKAFLKKKLPSYLIPFDFVVLDAFPLNSNGKIDRKLLQPPVCSVPIDNNDDSPQTSLESEIIEICSRLLKLHNISVNDSFFELGGDSLLGIRFINLLRDKYKIELPLRSLFDEPQLSEIANIINAARIAAANMDLEEGII
jgi:amino acid adenylation domain-containing protein